MPHACQENNGLYIVFPFTCHSGLPFHRNFPGIPCLLLGVTPGLPYTCPGVRVGPSDATEGSSAPSCKAHWALGSGMGPEWSSAQHVGWCRANQSPGCCKRANQNRRQRRLCACAPGPVMWLSPPCSGAVLQDLPGSVCPSQRNLTACAGSELQTCFAGLV